jgi:hypothetical protein
MILSLRARIVFAALLWAGGVVAPAWAADESAVALPAGVKVVWDAGKAFREKAPTRERICLNGLWMWQPADAPSAAPPAGNWGYFKVPGCWPGISDYMQKDCQTVYAHPSWRSRALGGVTAAWQEREIDIPSDWAGRRVAVSAEYLNSFAVVYLDGAKAGEIHFPGGDLDITAFCHPGARQRLAILVVAMPLKGVMLSYVDSESAREVKGSVPRRGLCGDVFLVATPRGGRIDDARAETSTRRRELGINAGLTGLAAGGRYRLIARVSRDGGKLAEFTSRDFSAEELQAGRFAFTNKWAPDRLWDTHTPGNMLSLEVSLLAADGEELDRSWPGRFGFRELWAEGRDFYLNGSRIFLSAVPLDNAQVSAGLSTYAAARESLARLQSFGINFVYTHNYDCLPGSNLGFEELLRAADDAGMLVSLTQPHFSHYEWQGTNADRDNGYARHAEFYARVAENHPSVVMYAMSHNATGYDEDMNPDLIDGIHAPRDTWSMKNVRLAGRAEAIVRGFDPTRIVYHHASGNLGSMHAINFYPNFPPVQELSDWFGHWAAEGVKPVFLCEFGGPFTWDWTMYRGWFNGKREWGSANVPWELCVAEWNAELYGGRAYQISEPDKADLRYEAKKLKAGQRWHRWDYPYAVDSNRFDERYPVFATYITENWRAFRGWGVSAISPWGHEHYWKPRDGVDRGRKELPTDWENLQRPGFSPDYVADRYERMDLSFERSDWIATPAAVALLRNNRPLLAFIAGKTEGFTSQDHNFLPGETVEKQIIIINSSREPVQCESAWKLGLPKALAGAKRSSIGIGQQERFPLRFQLPAGLAPGRYELSATFKFGGGETQRDNFFINVEASPEPYRAGPKIALFDPKGETGAWMKKAGLSCQVIEPATDLGPYDLLVIGKGGLTAGGAAPDLGRVRDGLKVIVFEQTSEVLEKRLGFRVAERGLRQVFPRLAGHPALAGLGEEELRDWRGDATLTPPRLTFTSKPMYGPMVEWSGLLVPRLWRCGNRGSVASVLIEKPARGDFMPILDGGFSLQYSPLLEFREGQGMILFCQMDVTGRTETDPAAEKLALNLFRYTVDWKPGPRRTAVYAGPPEGKSYLESDGVAAATYSGGALSPGQVLVAGPGSGSALAASAPAIADWLKAGGRLMAVGLGQDDADALLPFKVQMKRAEHISAFFEPLPPNSPLAGISPAEVQNRDPREMPLVAAGADVAGDGVVASAADGQGHVTFCQLAPWSFGDSSQLNLKRTRRRVSVLMARLLANLGVAGSTPLLDRFHQPVPAGSAETRWNEGLYLDKPVEWDDPYRFFRW